MIDRRKTVSLRKIQSLSLLCAIDSMISGFRWNLPFYSPSPRLERMTTIRGIEGGRGRVGRVKEGERGSGRESESERKRGSAREGRGGRGKGKTRKGEGGSGR